MTTVRLEKGRSFAEFEIVNVETGEKVKPIGPFNFIVVALANDFGMVGRDIPDTYAYLEANIGKEIQDPVFFPTKKEL